MFGISSSSDELRFDLFSKHSFCAYLVAASYWKLINCYLLLQKPGGVIALLDEAWYGNISFEESYSDFCLCFISENIL